MGAGGDIPRARIGPHSACTLALALSAVAAGCVDFVEPDLAELGAPVVLGVTVRVVGDSAFVEGELTPGIDEDGFIRELASDPVHVEHTAAAPRAVTETGTRTYDARVQLDAGATDDGVRIEAPLVLDVDAPTPVVDWPAVQRVGPSTVTAELDGSVVLRAAIVGPAVPTPDLREWSLRLEGDDAAVTITATGLPPDSIVVPPDLLPAPADGEIMARLRLTLSARVEPPPGDYIALFALETRATWTILTAPAPPHPVRSSL